MEFKRFFNISGTNNKICRLNLCHALKSRINFKTIEWLLNTVMFCSRQHILCSYRSSKYKQEHGCNRSCSQSWERKAMDLPPVFWYRCSVRFSPPDFCRKNKNVKKRTGRNLGSRIRPLGLIPGLPAILSSLRSFGRFENPQIGRPTLSCLTTYSIFHSRLNFLTRTAGNLSGPKKSWIDGFMGSSNAPWIVKSEACDTSVIFHRLHH